MDVRQFPVGLFVVEPEDGPFGKLKVANDLARELLALDVPEDQQETRTWARDLTPDSIQKLVARWDSFKGGSLCVEIAAGAKPTALVLLVREGRCVLIEASVLRETLGERLHEPTSRRLLRDREPPAQRDQLTLQNMLLEHLLDMESRDVAATLKETRASLRDVECIASLQPEKLKSLQKRPVHVSQVVESVMGQTRISNDSEQKTRALKLDERAFRRALVGLRDYLGPGDIAVEIEVVENSELQISFRGAMRASDVRFLDAPFSSYELAKDASKDLVMSRAYAEATDGRLWTNGEELVLVLPYGGLANAAPANAAPVRPVEASSAAAPANDRSQAPQIAAASARAPLKVLIVEDNYINAKILKKMLKGILGSDEQVSIVPNGLKAVEAARDEAFDLIFMDIQLPFMDGFEASARIRQQERESGRSAVPIIAVSGKTDIDMVRRLRQAGVRDFVPKPYQAADIERLIKSASSASLSG
jgi:CheY-like chemotaxis protein